MPCSSEDFLAIAASTEDDHQHARFRLDYASVRLLFLVMEESSVMWATLPKKETLARHGGIRIEDPLSGTWLVEYVEWWHAEAIPI